MGRLREYRFEADELQPEHMPFPAMAEEPGRYPAIKLATSAGNFALVRNIESWGHIWANVLRDAYLYLADARVPGNEAHRHDPIERGSGAGLGMIATGKAFQHVLTNPNGSLIDRSSYKFAYSPLTNAIGEVVMREDFANLEDYKTVGHFFEPSSDSFDPFFAIHSELPTNEDEDWGIRIHPLDGQEITWETGQIVVPSLLKANYAPEV